jgi:hypothetical protein
MIFEQSDFFNPQAVADKIFEQSGFFKPQAVAPT